VKSVWVDHGNDLDPVLLAKHDITQPYYDVRDPRIDLAYLERERDRGYSPGLYLCSQGDGWPSAMKMTGPEWADWAYQTVLKIAPKTSGTFPRVLLNCETHSASWLQSMIKHWRAHSPRRWTAWSMEGHQGGWMTAAFVQTVAPLIDCFMPQAYTGPMLRDESDRVVIDLITRGIPASKIYCMYKASEIGYWWEGCAFTMGSLPSV